MAFPRNARGSRQRSRSPVLLLLVCALAGALWWLFFSSSSRISPTGGAGSGAAGFKGDVWSNGLERKYLYWGSRVDCPGKHCDSCAGLGHQESSLRCALEEAMLLNRWCGRFFLRFLGDNGVWNSSYVFESCYLFSSPFSKFGVSLLLIDYSS